LRAAFATDACFAEIPEATRLYQLVERYYPELVAA
jgi:hypothetical protein